MSEIFKFFKPEYNPPNLTEVVGGPISLVELAQDANELFLPVDIIDSQETEDFELSNGDLFKVQPDETAFKIQAVTINDYQYRKFWIKQLEGDYTNIGVQIVNTEYPSVYSIATGDGDDLIANALTDPVTLDFQAGAGATVSIGASSAGNTIPVWVRQFLSTAIAEDDLVSFNINVIDLS